VREDDVFAKLAAMIALMPAPAPLDDRRWRHWHVASGQAVEVVMLRRLGPPEMLGTFVAPFADPVIFKIEDGRVWSQNGGRLISQGKKSSLRARKK
jgi:hypothetical protein